MTILATFYASHSGLNLYKYVILRTYITFYQVRVLYLESYIFFCGILVEHVLMLSTLE